MLRQDVAIAGQLRFATDEALAVARDLAAET
jgi:hypothetical protein